jgi:site-specific DNA-methyltransferase (adenine-specific)
MTLTPVPDEPRGRTRRPTATARFGSSRRENHDASLFYERFTPPEISDDTTLERPSQLDVIHRHDARDMAQVESNSVALVVTSPPYFAGKQYEESLGENGVPATYFEYLALLRDVFAECKRVLEPGGRIAVNVANLGRRPYRSLAGDVTDILQELGLLLRGEVVWWKGRAAGGSCAWGTFQRPTNPVLRDVTERIVIASKGRFDRALTPQQRLKQGLPSTTTISRDEFLEATTDLWEISPESARRVGHPAPFPVQLPKRLIELYTYEDDVVLDPFMGSGSTAVAAIRTNRHYVGFDNDKAYVDAARERARYELLFREEGLNPTFNRVHLPAVAVVDDDEELLARAVREGRQARDVAEVVLRDCGFTSIRADAKPRGLGIDLSFTAADQTGGTWAFDVSGSFTAGQSGLRRSDTLWKALGKAAVLHESKQRRPLVLLSTSLPAKGSAGLAALKVVRGPGKAVYDVVQLLDDADHERLRGYAVEGRPDH